MVGQSSGHSLVNHLKLDRDAAEVLDRTGTAGAATAEGGKGFVYPFLGGLMESVFQGTGTEWLYPATTKT